MPVSRALAASALAAGLLAGGAAGIAYGHWAGEKAGRSAERAESASKAVAELAARQTAFLDDLEANRLDGDDLRALNLTIRTAHGGITDAMAALPDGCEPADAHGVLLDDAHDNTAAALDRARGSRAP
jgi:hypothetical protein